MRPSGINFFFGIFVIAIFFSCERPISSELPNIVLIFTDDQGYGDVGSYGATGFSTPNLDQLANNGMRFTHFYSVQAVCSASRAGLLTGTYPNRIGISGALGPHSRNGLHDDEVTIAELLKQKGYATGIFGKWHLGHHERFLPLQHGFDEFVGLPYSNDMWPVDFDGSPVAETDHRKSQYPPLKLIEGNAVGAEIGGLEDQAGLTTLYTEKAVDFISRHKDKPFFIYLPHSMPHVPIAVSEKFKGKSEQGLYGDVMMEIDWSVGEIVKTLEKYDLDDNTLVIFTTDNGPWLNFGNHAGSTGGLREGKGTSFEGGQRVPCIMTWPQVIEKGKVNHQLAATVDVLPTLASITGTELPAHKLDGVSILPLLTGEDGATPRNELYYYYNRNSLEAVRWEHWKLVFPHPHRSYEEILPGNDGFPGKYRHGMASYALYNLRRDPGERYDVQELYPEILDSLEAIAEKARKSLGDDLTNREGNEVREAGKIVRDRKEYAQELNHLAIGKSVKLKNKYAERYSGGSENALTDGVASTDSITYPAEYSIWQGFQEHDLEATIDLEQKQSISKISAGFLHYLGAWIFRPEKVDFYISLDGSNFKKVGTNSSLIELDDPGLQKILHSVKCQEEARFVKVVAQNIGYCPSWHPGEGGKAWVFADEIMVE